MDLYDHILGGLFGQALGDAWAMPAYFNPAQTQRAYGDWITTFLPAPDDHPVHHGFPAARVTDDTEQAMALAAEIIREGGVTLEGAVRAIIGWYDRIDGDHSSYVGPSTRRGVQALKAGGDPRQTGRQGDTNGSAMRVSVVGLINPGDVDGAIRDAIISAIPTHNTDVGLSGACAVAAAVAQAMTLGNVPDALDTIVAAGMVGAQAGRDPASGGNLWIGASLTRRIQMAVGIARRPDSVRERLHELYDVVGTSLAIPESVAAAFGVLVMAEGDPQQTAIYAAALSGDADTVGAIGCAIAGAWRGAASFDPVILQTLIEANPDYDFEGTARGLQAIAEIRSQHV